MRLMPLAYRALRLSLAGLNVLGTQSENSAGGQGAVGCPPGPVAVREPRPPASRESITPRVAGPREDQNSKYGTIVDSRHCESTHVHCECSESVTQAPRGL